MAEYIERGALMQFPIRRDHYDRENGNEHFINGIETVLEYAENLPAADVAPVVHARWIPSESDFDDDDTLFDGEECCDWQCSACREDICYEDPMPMICLYVVMILSELVGAGEALKAASPETIAAAALWVLCDIELCKLIFRRRQR